MKNILVLLCRLFGKYPPRQIGGAGRIHVSKDCIQVESASLRTYFTLDETQASKLKLQEGNSVLFTLNTNNGKALIKELKGVPILQ